MRIFRHFRKTAVAGVAFAAAVAAWQPASAVTLDFAAKAAGNERSLANGDSLTFGSLTVTLNASNVLGGSAFPFLDDLSGGKPAGLGVCPNHPVNSCGAEDNITSGEIVTLSFDQTIDLFGLTFRDADHNPVNGTDTLLIDGTEFTFAAASAATFDNITKITFGFDNDDLQRSASQFYVNGATATAVPLPASVLMLLSAMGGLGALGMVSRRGMTA